MATKNKLDIFKLLAAMDRKQYNFYDSLTDEERKGFSAFLALKWGASVKGEKDIQHYYLAATNHYCNKHWYDIGKHPKLQWLELCAASPGVLLRLPPKEKTWHQWLPMKKKNAADNDIKKQLLEIYPNKKEDDIELLAQFTTKKEIKQYLKDHGDE